MKGIILAGGTGSRLWPATAVVSKQLLTVWDKPMLFYPITTLLTAGVTELLVITARHQSEAFRTLLGGDYLGVPVRFAEQERPAGIAEALLIGREFLDGQG